MGLIRKALSVSTLGGVKYTSRREAETKSHLANAQLIQAQARREAADAEAAKWEPIAQAIEAGEACWNDLPKFQRLSMPAKYTVRCLAAERRRSSAPGQHRATTYGDHNGR
jgi:hypothetical protein